MANQQHTSTEPEVRINGVPIRQAMRAVEDLLIIVEMAITARINRTYRMRLSRCLLFRQLLIVFAVLIKESDRFSIASFSISKAFLCPVEITEVEQ